MRYVFSLLVLTITCVLHAQPVEKVFNKVQIEIDGEQVFDVNEISQDSQGYMWMHTNLGLIRFDGLTGKKYDITSSDSSSIPIDYVSVLYTDSLGDLWIGANSGLSKYNLDCDCFYHYASMIDGIPMTMIRAITEDKFKNLWIGTRDGHLFQYKRETASLSSMIHKFTDSLTLTNNSISHLLADQNNNLWIGTYSGLVRINMSTGNVEQFLHDATDPNSLTDNRISALYEDQQGQILIGTFKSGFHIYDLESESLYRVNHNANNPQLIHAPFTEEKVYGDDPFVQIIHQDQKGDYWIGTTGKGVNYYDTTTKAFKNYSFNLINPQLISSIYEDRQGNLWIGGAGGGGLFKCNLFAKKYSLNTNFVNVEASYESAFDPGILWIKSREGGLTKMDLKTNKIRRYVHDQDNNESIGHNWVRSTYQENVNTLWVGIGTAGPYGGANGNGGVDKMDIASGKFTHFKLMRNDDGLDDFSYTPLTICEDSEGYLWLGAGTGGIFRSDKEKKEFKHFKLSKIENESMDAILNTVLIDSNGDLWASDFNVDGTLYLYDRIDNKFNPYLKGFKVTKVLIDRNGWLLISTWGKGLLHLDPKDGSYIQYTKDDGLPSNDALDLTEGDNRIYWIGTRMGPAQFDSKTGIISPIGLPKGRYNFGIFKSLDGQIFLGAHNGLASFYTHQVGGNPFPPQVDISGLLISNDNFLSGKRGLSELVFSHNQNDISFEFNALHYSDSEKNQYQYILTPINDEWINVGSERTARYFNLPPDSYTFEVKASNSDGVWSKISETVSFTIKPSWWTTWWAYLVYAVIAIAFADRFYRFQLSRRLAVAESDRLKEVDQLKNSLFTNITHEFRTPLTVIKGMTGAIKSNLENKELSDLGNSLEIIDRNSDSLLNLINEMLDLAKIESGNMELNLVQADIIPYIKYLTQSFHSLAEEKSVDFSFHCELEHLEMDLDVNKFTAIVTNLLSNAIKFTPENGEVSVLVDRIQENGKDHLILKVKDTGIGISAEEQLHIFDKFYQVDNSSSRLEKGTGIGLALVKEFVLLMKGSIDVESAQGKGSVFNILIPVTNDAVSVEGSELISASSMIRSNIVSAVSEDEEVSMAANKDHPMVLIIEDNLDVAHYIKTCLIDKYQIRHAQNGAIGIEMALEKIPDIIISDVMMPEKDGFEVCQYLKTDELTDHIPIIMLTAKATFDDRLTGLSHGADAYLTKPFEKLELLTRIEQLILLRKKMLSKFEKTGIDRLLHKKENTSESRFLNRIISIINENLENSDFGPTDLANQLHFSESQLYRKLKATSGKSTAIFIRSIRLQLGKDLMVTTDKTISEVAYEVGFNDPAYFSRAFKKEFGQSPSELTR